MDLSSPKPPASNGQPDMGDRAKATLAPRQTGEIFSDAVQLLREHLNTMILIALPFCCLELFVREYATILTFRIRQGTGQEFETFTQIFSMILIPLLGSVILFLMSRTIQQVLAGVLIGHTHVVSGLALPERLRQNESNTDAQTQTKQATEHPIVSIKRGKHFWFRLIVTDVIFGSFMIFAILIVPSALLMGALFLQSSAAIIGASVLSIIYIIVALLAIWLRWALYPQAIVLEDKGPLASLQRSAQLMGPANVTFSQSPKLRLSGLLLLYWFIAIPLQSVFFVPLSILGTLAGQAWYEPPPLTEVSLVWAVPIALVQIATNSFLFPIIAIMSTHFYYDLRVRYEGWGLLNEPS